MIIVVIPYCFLLDHHVHNARKLLGQCVDISIISLKGKDIEENILPNDLRDRDTLPSLLFVSLEAIRMLIEYHEYYFGELQMNDRLFKIYPTLHNIITFQNFNISSS